MLSQKLLHYLSILPHSQLRTKTRKKQEYIGVLPEVCFSPAWILASFLLLLSVKQPISVVFQSEIVQRRGHTEGRLQEYISSSSRFYQQFAFS